MKFYKVLATYPMLIGFVLPVLLWIITLPAPVYLLLCLTVGWAHYVGYIHGSWKHTIGKGA